MMRSCTGFLLLLRQITINVVTLNSKGISSYCSGCKDAGMDPQGCVASGSSGASLFLVLSSF